MSLGLIDQHPMNTLPLHSPGSLSVDSLSTFDEYAANPRFRQLQGELRSLLFNGAASRGSTRAPTPEEPESHRTPGHELLLLHLRRSQAEVPFAALINYLKVWTSECAPWLDMFDQQRHFGIQVPILAQRSPAILYALLALSARQFERHKRMKDAYDSLKLYQESIASLTELLQVQDPNVLVAACILCVLEMMSASPRDWRRHTEGCAALFEAFGVHGFSGGLLQAVFWCYARMDLCGAIIADGAESTVLPIDKWVLAPEIGQTFLEQGAKVPDMHANYAVYLCARTCDLLAARTRFVEMAEMNGYTESVFADAWKRLWAELQQWLDQRPPEMRPIKYTHAGNQFPAIFFAHWSAISSNQLYHTACILLLEMRPPEALSNGSSGGGGTNNLASQDQSMMMIHQPLWHARRVVGISLTNPHRGCLNNAIQPLYVAGKLFSHPSEHRIIVNLIREIETCTGWGSGWRIKDLETAWGYEHGTF